MNSAGSQGHRPEADPALLAFIKCHVRSVATWDALCVLAREVGRWFTQNQLERELGMPPARVSAALLGPRPRWRNRVCNGCAGSSFSHPG